MSSSTINIEGVGDVVLTRSRKSRHIRLRINQEGKPTVSCPPYTPNYLVKRFVKSKADWIKKHSVSTPEFVNGSRVGRNHTVVIADGKSLKARVSKNRISVDIPPGKSIQSTDVQSEINKAAIRALRKEAKQLLPDVVEEWAAKKVGKYKRVSVKNIKSRWGSYSSNGNISLSLYCVQLPDELIDYIVVHELSHSVHMNHSKKFWAHVEKFIPDYKQKRKMLHSFKMTVTPR